MIALPMTLHSVAAMGATGVSYSKETYVNTGGALYPCLNDCEHTHLGYPDNMMVGLGLYTHYDTNPYVEPAYNYGNWWFCTQAGWNTQTVTQMPPMGCIFDVDFGLGSAYHATWYDYSLGTWTNGYYYDGVWRNIDHYCNIVSDQFPRDLIGNRFSAEGMTQGIFFYYNWPWTIYYRYAQTQTPPGHYAPVQSYAFLTAHHHSWYGDWGYDT